MSGLTFLAGEQECFFCVVSILVCVYPYIHTYTYICMYASIYTYTYIHAYTWISEQEAHAAMVKAQQARMGGKAPPPTPEWVGTNTAFLGAHQAQVLKSIHNIYFNHIYIQVSWTIHSLKSLCTDLRYSRYSTYPRTTRYQPEVSCSIHSVKSLYTDCEDPKFPRRTLRAATQASPTSPRRPSAEHPTSRRQKKKSPKPSVLVY